MEVSAAGYPLPIEESPVLVTKQKRFSGSEIYKSRLSGSERKISGSKNIFKCYGTVTVTLCFKDDKSNESQNCIGFKVFLIFF